MAKSIWKRGERMTRLEKKRLRKVMPHPNRGRRLYQWKAEHKRILNILAPVLNDNRPVDWTAIADKPTFVPNNACPRITNNGICDDCAGDETYALPAYDKDDGPLSQEQLDRLYKNTTARPGEPLSETDMEALRKSILASSERLDLPPGTDVTKLYME